MTPVPHTISTKAGVPAKCASILSPGPHIQSNEFSGKFEALMDDATRSGSGRSQADAFANDVTATVESVPNKKSNTSKRPVAPQKLPTLPAGQSLQSLSAFSHTAGNMPNDITALADSAAKCRALVASAQPAIAVTVGSMDRNDFTQSGFEQGGKPSSRLEPISGSILVGREIPASEASSPAKMSPAQGSECTDLENEPPMRTSSSATTLKESANVLNIGGTLDDTGAGLEIPQPNSAVHVASERESFAMNDDSSQISAALLGENVVTASKESSGLRAKSGSFTLSAGLEDKRTNVGLSKKSDINSVQKHSAERPAPSSDSSAVAGTGVAKGTLLMQKADKMNDSSAWTEQNLPTDGRTAALEVPAQTGKVGRTALPHLNHSEDAVQGGTQTFSPTTDTPLNDLVASSPMALPSRTVECTHDLMLVHTLQLCDSSADSLEVVIRPGTGLELSLNLKVRGDAVEMHAVVNRGDFQMLNQHWPELQQQLQARGIKLGPLVSNNSTANHDAADSRNSNRRETPDEGAPKGAFAEFVLSGAARAVQSAGAAARRGWELWA